MSHRREKRARQAARFAIMTAVSIEGFTHAVMLRMLPTNRRRLRSSGQIRRIAGNRRSPATASRCKRALDTKRNSNLPIESVAAGRHRQNARPERRRIAAATAGHPDRPLGANGQGNSVLIDGLRQNLTTLNGDIFLTGKEFYVSGEASGGGAGGNAQYGRSRPSRANRSAASTSSRTPTPRSPRAASAAPST